MLSDPGLVEGVVADLYSYARACRVKVPARCLRSVLLLAVKVSCCTFVLETQVNRDREVRRGWMGCSTFEQLLVYSEMVVKGKKNASIVKTCLEKCNSRYSSVRAQGQARMIPIKKQLRK